MTQPTQPPEDGSFALDSARMWGRRAALGAVVAGIAGAGLLLRGGPRPPMAMTEANVTGTGADGAQCVKIPAETAGPFPADGTNRLRGATVNVLTETGVMRRDIRGSFAGLTAVAEGVVLEIELSLVDVDAACAPLAGLAVYVWHCDAAGEYSIYGLDQANYLRGMQESDAAGVVRFTTIFPGTYEGRWPHVHFEVFASSTAAETGRDALLTAQIALPGAETMALYAADTRYAASVGPMSRVSFEGDNVFGDNTPEQRAQQMMQLAGDAASEMTGRVTVGLQRKAA